MGGSMWSEDFYRQTPERREHVTSSGNLAPTECAFTSEGYWTCCRCGWNSAVNSKVKLCSKSGCGHMRCKDPPPPPEPPSRFDRKEVI